MVYNEEIMSSKGVRIDTEWPVKSQLVNESQRKSTVANTTQND